MVGGHACESASIGDGVVGYVDIWGKEPALLTAAKTLQQLNDTVFTKAEAGNDRGYRLLP